MKSGLASTRHLKTIGLVSRALKRRRRLPPTAALAMFEAISMIGSVPSIVKPTVSATP